MYFMEKLAIYIEKKMHGYCKALNKIFRSLNQSYEKYRFKTTAEKRLPKTFESGM